MSNNYCQCPVCYGVYTPITKKQAVAYIKKNKRYYSTMKEFQKDLFDGEFKTLDLFTHCHYCGTENVEFIEALDLNSSPLCIINPIIFEKKVDKS